MDTRAVRATTAERKVIAARIEAPGGLATLSRESFRDRDAGRLVRL